MSVRSLLDRFSNIEFAGEPVENSSFSIQTLLTLPLLLQR
jgi:hypothetical protein